jgi:hypothetical protein
MPRPLLIAISVLCAAGTAHGAGVTIQVNLTADGAAECSVKIDEKGDTAHAKLQVAVSNEHTPLSANNAAARKLAFAVLEKNGAERPLKPSTAATQLITLSDGPQKLEDAKAATYLVRNEKKDVLCKLTPTAQAAEAEDQGCRLGKALADAQAYTNDPQHDLVYSARHVAGPKEGWTGGRHFVVVHGPNGETINTLPADLTERDSIDLVVIAPADAKVEWPPDKLVCQPPPWYRVLSKAAPEAGAGATKAAAGGERTAQPTEFWQGQAKTCADKLEYTVKITLPNCAVVEKKQVFTTRPMYDFFVGGGFGYDFGSPVDLSSQPKVEDSQTKMVLVRSRPTTGFKPILTLTYFPFGMDPERFRWWAAPGPFVAMDPTRVSSGAIAGIDWTLPHGFGLLTGVSVFESEKLVSPVGLKPGDEIPSGATLQTKQVFNSDGVGFFLGANFPTELIQQFLSAAAKGFGAASTK